MMKTTLETCPLLQSLDSSLHLGIFYCFLKIILLEFKAVAKAVKQRKVWLLRTQQDDEIEKVLNRDPVFLWAINTAVLLT